MAELNNQHIEEIDQVMKENQELHKKFKDCEDLMIFQ